MLPCWIKVFFYFKLKNILPTPIFWVLVYEQKDILVECMTIASELHMQNNMAKNNNTYPFA